MILQKIETVIKNISVHTSPMMHDECQIIVPVVVFPQMKGDCYQMLCKKLSSFILYCSIDELYVIYNNRSYPSKEWSNLHLKRCDTGVLGPLTYVSQIGKLCEK